jgi:antitoxin (DNA-binding transcriptional repressor) of toxin-antitoxin stability system
MATLQVKNRDFQRSTAAWLRRVRQGDTVVIVSSEGPPLTLTAGRPKRGSKQDWTRHFEWLKKQPVSETNPVDELRKTDKR